MSEIIKSEIKILKLMYDKEIPKLDGSGHYQGYRIIYKTKKGEEKKHTIPYAAIKNNANLQKIQDVKVGDTVIFSWQDKGLIDISKPEVARTTDASNSKKEADSVDPYQIRMIMQNAYRHAVNIAIHNAGKKELAFTDVRDLAHMIAKDVWEFNLTPSVPKAQIVKTNELTADNFDTFEPELEELPY